MAGGKWDGAEAALTGCKRRVLECLRRCATACCCCCGWVVRPENLRQKLEQTEAVVEAEFHQGNGTKISRILGGYLPREAADDGATCHYTTLEFLFTAVKSATTCAARADELVDWWTAAREGAEEFGVRQINGRRGQWHPKFFSENEVRKVFEEIGGRKWQEVEEPQAGGNSSPGWGTEQRDKSEPYGILFEVNNNRHTIGVAPWPPGGAAPTHLLIMEPNFGVIRIPATKLEETLKLIKVAFYTGMECTLKPPNPSNKRSLTSLLDDHIRRNSPQLGANAQSDSDDETVLIIKPRPGDAR